MFYPMQKFHKNSNLLILFPCWLPTSPTQSTSSPFICCWTHQRSESGDFLEVRVLVHSWTPVILPVYHSTSMWFVFLLFTISLLITDRHTCQFLAIFPSTNGCISQAFQILSIISSSNTLIQFSLWMVYAAWEAAQPTQTLGEIMDSNFMDK